MPPSLRHLLLLAAALLVAPPAQGAVINVPASDVAALVMAITTANGNGQDDDIVLGAGSTYTLTAVQNGATGLPVVTSKITIQGNGATIQRAGIVEFRLFDVGTTGDLTLDDLTVKGGKLTFTASRDGGAGIRVVGAGKLTLTDTTVTQNTCTGGQCFGGGIFARDNAQPVVTLIDSEVSENVCQNGGGIALNHNDQSLHLTRTVVRGNSGMEGGGIATFGHDTVTITDSTIVGNTVTSVGDFGGALGGGILDVGGGTWTIAGTTISGNSASGTNTNTAATNIYGGGMAENGGATISLVNSTITGNSLGNTAGGLVGGAGLFSEGGGTWTLNNVTIGANTITGSNGSGGGMEATRGIFRLRNSIVHGNTASRNPDCSALGAGALPVFDSFIRTDGHNIVGTISGCTGFTATTGDQVGVDPLLGALADNGGLTETRAIPAGSPAENAGDPGAVGSPTACAATDQRGVPRPQGGGCDIGAFEIVSTATTTTTVAPTTSTTTVTPTTSTTTTTVPGACDVRSATFVSILCRLDVLVGQVQASGDLGRLKKGIEGAVTKARLKTQQGREQDAGGRTKKANTALKKAIRRMITFSHKLRSLNARRIIPPATSEAFLGQAAPIEEDMRALRVSLR